MTFHDGEMSNEEIHGTQLRMAVDYLELATDGLAFDATPAVIEAEKLLAAVKDAREQLAAENE